MMLLYRMILVIVCESIVLVTQMMSCHDRREWVTTPMR